MRWLLAPLVAAFLTVSAPSGFAQQGHPPSAEPSQRERQEPRQRSRDPSPDGPRFSPGDRLPEQFRREEHAAPDWRARNLSPAPRGYRWYCSNGRDCFLVRTDTGVVRESRWRDDRESLWRQRYARSYGYGDDGFYRDCRERADPGAVIMGGLIGGLLAYGLGEQADASTIFTGVIVGAIATAALTRDMDCEDRSYAYTAYHRALNGGRAGDYRWRNPRNDHFGVFTLRRFYFDQDGFRCAAYRHVSHAGRERRHDGRACRQPDGAWVFLD